MLVSHSSSVQNGWTYVSALPSSVVLAKAEAIKRTILLFAALTLGGGGLAALYLAYRNSRPFAELLSSWTELHSRIEHQLPLLRETVTERLLRGYYKQEEEAKEAVAEARIPLNGEGYFAASVIVYKDELAAPLTQDPQELSSFLTDRMAFLFGGMDVMINTEGNKADMIVSFPEADRERLPELLRQRWEEQQDQLQEKNGMRLIVGLGRTTSQLHELWRSHREARQALEYYIPSEQGAVIRYEDRATDSSHYYYPLDVELKLIQTVKHGDLEELERMLQHIQEVNYSERRLNGATRRQLNQELQGTLAKLLEQMEAGSEAFAEWKEKLPVAVTAEVETFDWEGWKESLRLLCSHIACHKKEKHNRTAEAMLEMTAQQFADPNFSLAGMASHFKLSESFISVLFKDYAGETFSEYLERLRLTRACTLLKESDKSIIQIAQETGYNSDKTFRRAFKRVYGVQPTAYRESSQT
ncbi:helix-turn-helix domain-containing protein [Paenibacillus sp. CC-CFT747]|nr:helix-turn-helix domain-containing protein [Paenibacillus sp. CC-CFT747]